MTMFNGAEKQSFLDKMKSFETKDLQDTYLQQLLEVKDVLRRRPRDIRKRKTEKPTIERSAVCKYFVSAGDNVKVQVRCFFLSDFRF